MLFFVRTTAGSTVYARLKNRSAYFWDFIALAWVSVINDDCKKPLTEYPDGDPQESLYMAEVVFPPGGPWIQEAVDSSDNSVIAFDNNVMGELIGVPSPDASQQEKIEFIYQYLAFKRTATSIVETMHNSDGTAFGTAALSDDGTIFTKNKVS